jgi:uncharacterized protein (DUF433 family)
MAMPQPHAFPHIVRVPGVIGGEPTIQGTRISVACIVQYMRVYPSIEEILRALPHINRAQVEEALAFYEVNREEIDGYIAEEEAEDAG